MVVANAILVGFCGHCFVVIFFEVFVSLFARRLILAAEVVIVEQEEVADRAAEPHFLAVQGVGFDVFLLFPQVYLFVGYALHTFAYLSFAFIGGKRKVLADTVNSTLQRVD